MKKHRGEIVEDIVRKSGFSLKKLSERLKISRNTLYNRFRDPELSYEFITTVGKIVHYNFTVDFPELETELNNQAHDPWVQYGDNDVAELLKQEKKYSQLLERYNYLLTMLVRITNDGGELKIFREDLKRFMDEKM